MSRKPKLINVSNRLPVTVTDEGITRSSGGLVAALEGLDAERFDLDWIGWPGGEITNPVRQRQVAEQLRRDFGCTPVFLTAEEAHGHYEGFANSSLWPLLHYMPTRFRYEPGWDAHYRAVNQRFADKVLETAQDGDLVWVHDYQLMLLPRMLKEARPGLRVGFFLHTPFPSYEVLRMHPRREELAAGMLGADLVGFHTFGYLRHFRSSAVRLLDAESEVTQLRHAGHTANLGVYPIGINAPRFAAELRKPELAEQVERFRRNFDNKRVVLSVERLDYTKGLIHRLEAIDLFLAQCDAATRDRIKFIFVSVPSRENVGQYRELREELESRIGRLNGKYTTLVNSPIHFIHGSVSFTELCALYAIAEVCLVTPLMDGMNLVAKEYVACQDEASAGVLVLSEFAGAAEELFHALLVNPFDVEAVAGALSAALPMPPAERRERMGEMRDRVMKADARWWARSFINDLSAPSISRRTGNGEPSGRSIADARDRLRAAVTAGASVALFLDYDGTLREIEMTPAAARPNRDVLDLLGWLRRRDHVSVTLVSGRTPRDLEAFLGDFREFGLIAEHGASFRRPGSSQWESLDGDVHYEWKEPVRRILELYEASTPGSFVEEKRTGLVWHHRKADPEFGDWKAKQLTAELAGLLTNQPVHVRQGRKIVEVTPAQVNKGAAVARLVASSPADVVLVAGDDVTDEHMFRLEMRNLISIKIGDGDTRAAYRLRTPGEFRRFLTAALSEAHVTV